MHAGAPADGVGLRCLPSRRDVQGLIVFSRLGVYLRLPGVDVDAFSEAMAGSGIMGYIDTLSGGRGRGVA